MKRSVITEDYLYSITLDRMIVAGLDDLSRTLASIEQGTRTPHGQEYRSW